MIGHLLRGILIIYRGSNKGGGGTSYRRFGTGADIRRGVIVPGGTLTGAHIR